LIATQATLTIVLAILIAIGAIASCVHKRKPIQKPYRQTGDIEDDMVPLGIPSGDNASELERYSTKSGYNTELRQYPSRGGYIPTAVNEQGDIPSYNHRASTVYRDPFVNQNPTPVYEEYSSNYGSSRAQSVASRQPSIGHGRMGSIGHESEFHYRPIGSPPPGARTR